MHSRIAGRLSYANVMATIAVFIAVGGTAYAGATLGNGVVQTRNIANGAVTSPKIRNGAVSTAKLANGAVTAGKLSVTLPGAQQLKFGTGWSGANTDGEPAAACYEDREGIVHFIGAIHSAMSGALITMATLPKSCPPPPRDLVVQVPANLTMGVQSMPEMMMITIRANGALINVNGIAGNGTDGNDNLTLESISYRAR
jgi:hypothetical protein